MPSSTSRECGGSSTGNKGGFHFSVFLALGSLRVHLSNRATFFFLFQKPPRNSIFLCKKTYTLNFSGLRGHPLSEICPFLVLERLFECDGAVDDYANQLNRVGDFIESCRLSSFFHSLHRDLYCSTFFSYLTRTEFTSLTPFRRTRSLPFFFFPPS